MKSRISVVVMSVFIAVGVYAQTQSNPAANEEKRAVDAIRRVADQIRCCPEVTSVTQTKEKKPWFVRSFWRAPTDVRFDLQRSDSLIAPFTGTVEFSVSSGMSRYWRTAKGAASDEVVVLPLTTRHRYFYRVDENGAHLDLRT
jgi:hypothetical protein